MPACLLPLLQPVRLCLLPFLGDADAVRLLQTSHATASTLLAGYSLERVFTPYNAGELKQAVALYGRYHMRILRISLAESWQEPLVDSASGAPLLPASLLALALGSTPAFDGPLLRCAAWTALSGAQRDESQKQQQGKTHEAISGDDDEGTFHQLVRPVDLSNMRDRSFNIQDYGLCLGAFNQPLPRGALPHGLRFLQAGRAFDQPLECGSIPDTVQVIAFGDDFNQPLSVGHLPASLHTLVLGYRYAQPLLPGVLPPDLRRLRIGFWFNQPLLQNALPPRLREISLGWAFNKPLNPGVLPPSVTHIRLSHDFNKPLEIGSIPHGVLHLNCAEMFDQPIPPGVLPASLREVALSRYFSQTLQPGSLPDGLQLLAFHIHSAYPHRLLPGVIPPSVRVVSMGEEYSEQLEKGSIPETVEWIRLPRLHATKGLHDVLAPSTRLVWWGK